MKKIALTRQEKREQKAESSWQNVNYRLVKAIDDARLARHAQQTDKVLRMNPLFTSACTIPTANVTYYESFARELRRNWLADSEFKIAYAKKMVEENGRSAKGYASADD